MRLVPRHICLSVLAALIAVGSLFVVFSVCAEQVPKENSQVANPPKNAERTHWSFQPVKRVDAAIVSGKFWPRNKIDHFVLARLEKENLAPSAEAPRLSWLRRVYFTLTGLPPSPEQVKAFTEDSRADAYERVVDELLKSPRYGEQWAQHWLDVVRYADTDGFEVNTPRNNAWPYRDYVIRAFNEDKPYDRFIREQLAGDGLNAGDATGFMVASPVLLPGQIGADDVSKRQARQDALDEIIVCTGGTMLGLTIGCARCHDHKFDPITARDYYAMQAFFAGVEYGERPIESAARSERLAHATELAPQIDQFRTRLAPFEPGAFRGRTLLIDEEDSTHVTALKPTNGPGGNPAGTKRGYLNDVGDANRIGNISRGRYLWWNNLAGQDTFTYNPGAAGRFNLWISWGIHGSGVHTRDARYVLDRDGDLTTRGDQRELAKVDQYYPAGVTTGTTEMAPQWSGLFDVGLVDLTESSKIILRGGDTGTGITADVIVLQEAEPDAPVAATAPSLPHLRAPVSALQNVERFSPISARFVRLNTRETIDSNRHEPCIDELEIFSTAAPTKNIALTSAGAKATCSGSNESASHQLAHVNDGVYGNEHSWMSNERGGGWVQIELPAGTKIDRVVWGRDRNGKYQDRLPVRYQIDVSVDGKSWQTVASNSDRMPVGSPSDPTLTMQQNGAREGSAALTTLIAELARLQAEKTKLEMPEMVWGGIFRNPDKTFVLNRGDPEQRKDSISPAVPALFNLPAIPDPLPEQKRRLALADWIVSKDNPLTARVMVNRIWQYHFGRGLVETPNDFGLNGTRPTHPELLDWLASEFVASGWSVKHMQRLIVLSATFRQSSVINPAAAAIDRDTKLLWRFPPRRLEAESMRDSVLLVSGDLNLKTGGPGFSFFKSRGGLDGFPPVEQLTPEELRRMVYAHKVRREPVPVFGVFDCPDAGQSMPSRTQSTTAIQALNLFNSNFIADRAKAFAERVKKVSSEEPEDQVTKAFEFAYGRKPDSIELAASAKVVRSHGLTPLCRVIFNSNEFLFIP